MTKAQDECRKCGGAMRPSKAIAQTFYTGDEGTMSPAGPGALVDCLKCELCGWSVSVGVADAPAPDLRAAAQAVLDRWNSPKWEWHKQGPTADLMADLACALGAVDMDGSHYLGRYATADDEVKVTENPAGVKTPDGEQR